MMNWFAILALSLSSAFSWGALTLPPEEELPALMLNQNDNELYRQGIIPEGRPSSLCGPTSAVN